MENNLNENSVENVEVESTEQKPKVSLKEKYTKNKKKVWIAGLAALLLIGLSVGLGVGIPLMNKNQTNQNDNVKPSPEYPVIAEMFNITTEGVLSIKDGWIDTEQGIEWAKTGHLVIPKEINETPVKSTISPEYFPQGFSASISSYIKTITFEKGSVIEEIGNWTFAGAENAMNELVLPETLTTIGKGSFKDCTGLTGDLIIPKKVNEIAEYAFSGSFRKNGNQIVFHDNVEIIGQLAFQVTGFKTINKMPEGLKEIKAGAFNSIEFLTGDLIIPDGVIIGNEAFSYCEKITSISVDQELFDQLGLYNPEGPNNWATYYWNEKEGDESNVKLKV
ncbi:MAG: leucine-rich repeat domain-containing protein [Mycoplasma sp.]